VTPTAQAGDNPDVYQGLTERFHHSSKCKNIMFKGFLVRPA
jgi:hypothetical protein